MEGKPQESARMPGRNEAETGEPDQRRPYQKPRIERHVASSLILGNVTGTPVGLSGGERRTQP